MKKLLIATHNHGKIEEFKQILSPKDIEVVSAIDFDLEEPVEDGDTFHANALIKAKAAMEATGIPALADDSGLCVNALNGDPGIFSARWAQKEGRTEKNFPMAMQRIHDELGQDMKSECLFYCCSGACKTRWHTFIF